MCIFTYDELNRFTYASGTFGANQSQTSCGYGYNSIGNITSKCGAVFEYNHLMHPSAVSKNRCGVRTRGHPLAPALTTSWNRVPN